MQAGAVGSFTLVLTVAVGLSSHRDGAWDGGRQGGKLRLRVRVAVLLGRTGNGHCWASLGVGAGLAQLREGYAGTSPHSCHVLACHTGRLCPWNYPALGHGWCLLSCRDLSALCGAGMFFVPAGDKAVCHSRVTSLEYTHFEGNSVLKLWLSPGRFQPLAEPSTAPERL